MSRRMVEDTLKSVGNWLTRNPQGQAIATQAERAEAAEKLAERQRAAHASATERRAAEERARQHARDRLALKDDVDVAKAALQNAYAQLDACDYAYRVSVLESDMRLARERRVLVDTMNPLQTAFIAEMRLAIETTQAAQHTAMQTNIEGRQIVVWSNHAEIRARVSAIREALQECGETGELMYLALSDDELTKRLDALRASIPALPMMPEELKTVPADARPVWA